MLVVKLVGIALIIAASTFIGYLKSYNLSARCKNLSLFLDGINALYENIEQGGETLDNAIANAFSKCSFLIREDEKFHCCDDFFKKDKNLIDDFFKYIGLSSKKVECDRINNFKIKVKKQINDAENENQQKGKIYRVLGLCVGLTIAILLI